MYFKLVQKVVLSCFLLFGVIQLAFAQRWAVNDTIYIYENTSVELYVLSNDEGEELSIFDVEVADYPFRGSLVKDFSCNCFVFTPFSEFGVTVFEDSFTYLLKEEIEAFENGGEVATTLSTNVATVFLYFLELECEECVWPGDVNADGICNAWDLLPIGIGHGTYGYARPDASILWEGQNCYDWTNSFSGDLNYKHADCNGDGWINNDDVAAIEANYGLTRSVSFIPEMPSETGDLTVTLEILNSSVSVGDTVVTNILVSGADGDADLYGLAFSISYNIVPFEGTMNVNFPVSFLSNGENTISVQRVVENTIEAAITRTNSEFANGTGLIGVVSFVMEDVLAGKNTEEYLSLTFNNITATTPTGSKLSVIPQGAEVDLTLDQKLPVISQDFKVFPIPSNHQLTIQTGNTKAYLITLVNNAGKTVFSSTVSNYNSELNIDLQNLSTGVYFLQLHTEKGIITQKVPIIK